MVILRQVLARIIELGRRLANPRWRGGWRDAAIRRRQNLPKTVLTNQAICRARHGSQKPVTQLVAKNCQMIGAIGPRRAERRNPRFRLGWDARINDGVGQPRDLRHRFPGPKRLVHQQRLNPIFAHQFRHIAKQNPGDPPEHSQRFKQTRKSAQFPQPPVGRPAYFRRKFRAPERPTGKAGLLNRRAPDRPQVEGDTMPPALKLAGKRHRRVQVARSLGTHDAEVDRAADDHVTFSGQSNASQWSCPAQRNRVRSCPVPTVISDYGIKSAPDNVRSQCSTPKTAGPFHFLLPIASDYAE